MHFIGASINEILGVLVRYALVEHGFYPIALMGRQL